MEAVNSLAGAAANAVWGSKDESHRQEPVSGRSGDTSKGEPYDAGNMENPPLASPTDAKSTADFPTSSVVEDGSSNISKKEGEEQEKTDDSATKPSKDDGNTEVVSPEEAEVDVDGPGPRPLDEVAKERGGDAGNAKAKPLAGEEGKESEDKGAAEEEDNTPKGDGTKLVKASGLNADGGDFDATKPGAGREADRLMEEKGIQNPTAAAAAAASESQENKETKETPSTPKLKSEDSVNTTGSGDTSGSGKKKGFREKIKEKLGGKKDN